MSQAARMKERKGRPAVRPPAWVSPRALQRGQRVSRDTLRKDPPGAALSIPLRCREAVRSRPPRNEPRLPARRPAQTPRDAPVAARGRHRSQLVRLAAARVQRVP
jgi:hypothetical protein